MAEALAAVGALEWLLPGVDADVLLQVVLELEGLHTLRTLELAQLQALFVTDHVTLQTVDVGEGLAAHLTHLGLGGVERRVFLELRQHRETDAALDARVLRRRRRDRR